jgi:hypothetical protein
MDVIEHLENFCGPVVEGWRTDPDGNKMSFQVVRLERGPVEGSVTFSTLGLNFHRLKSATSAKPIRHELVMLARNDAIPENLGPVLQQVAAEAVDRGYAYLRGNVIGPRGQLFPGTSFTAMYVANPVYFPEEFAAHDQVAFAWLVPITTEEANFVATKGWPKFEDVLIRENPDLLDMHRQSVVR